jgi:hypothetical protein
VVWSCLYVEHGELREGAQRLAAPADRTRRGCGQLVSNGTAATAAATVANPGSLPDFGRDMPLTNPPQIRKAHAAPIVTHGEMQLAEIDHD